MTTRTIIIIAGAIATTIAIFFIATWYYPSSTTTAETQTYCQYLRDYSAHLDSLSFEVDNLERGIRNRTAVNAEQHRAWVDYLPELIEEYNALAKNYNTLRKQYRCEEDVPAEYYLK